MRSEKAPLRMPPNEQLGSLRKADCNPGSEPRVEHGPYVSFVPESRLRYGNMPREARTGSHASGSDDPGLNVASQSVGQDPADTGADGAPRV